MNHRRQIICTLFGLAILLCRAIPAAQAQNFGNFPVTITAESALNTGENDYAPFVTPDGNSIFFNSGRKEGSFGNSDVYRAKRSGDTWKGVLNAGQTFNTKGSDGSVAMAGDGKTVVFASDERADGQGDEDIYTAEFVDGELKNVHNLGAVVNSRYWDSQPTISKDGSTVFFASNRPGGRGGTDIWSTRKAGGAWGQPVNMGPAVNSKNDERSPHVTPDGGTMFYSSNGPGGYGGFDVFMSVKDGNDWAKGTNLGTTINTSSDELFFYPPFAGEKFYFASSREEGGTGKLDIFSGTPNIYGAGNYHLTVIVLDSTTGKPIPATVAVMDMKQSTTISTFFTNSMVDEYSQVLPAARSYRVIVQVKGQQVKIAEVKDPPANSEQVVRFLFGPVSIADFDLGKYNIPFFVTGYYRPNTPENLSGLFPLLDDYLGDAGYIERFKQGSKRHDQYIKYSKSIVGIFDAVYRKSVDTILPGFSTLADENEMLEFVVTGYADPQPIAGDYLENDTISFEDIKGNYYTVTPESEMDNFRLSGLRAWYSGQYLNYLLSAAEGAGHPEYASLKRQGRIRYRYVGGGISGDSRDYAVQRRIHIQIRRVTRDAGGGRDVLDSNTQ